MHRDRVSVRKWLARLWRTLQCQLGHHEETHWPCMPGYVETICIRCHARLGRTRTVRRTPAA